MADATLDYPSSPPPNTMRRDVISAYCAAGARIASWVVVSAVVYRRLGVEAFAVLAFIRSTIGILNYASVGLAPVIIRLFAEARLPRAAIPVSESSTLEYASPIRVEPAASVQGVYANGVAWSAITCVLGVVLLIGYVVWIDNSHRPDQSMSPETTGLAFLFGLGILFRLLSDAPSAVLQTSGRIVLDNTILMVGEILWAGTTAGFVLSMRQRDINLAWAIGGTFCLTSALVLVCRWMAAEATFPPTSIRFFQYLDRAILVRMFRSGLSITAAQLADYLYAPTDFILIWLLLDLNANAAYSPAVQIDAGLLLLVTGIASVILPRAALAHVAGENHQLRRYYLHGTFFSGGILLIAALLVWLLSPLIFKLWFNDPMPATQAILPLILIHTVIGGSSAVGRSILLGMGKVKPFTIAVLIAGISNVILSFVFVQYLHLGLRGIVLGTVVAVVGRCAIWMPWYVMRSLR